MLYINYISIKWDKNSKDQAFLLMSHYRHSKDTENGKGAPQIATCWEHTMRNVHGIHANQGEKEGKYKTKMGENTNRQCKREGSSKAHLNMVRCSKIIEIRDI